MGLCLYICVYKWWTYAARNCKLGVNGTTHAIKNKSLIFNQYFTCKNSQKYYITYFSTGPLSNLFMSMLSNPNLANEFFLK